MCFSTLILNLCPRGQHYVPLMQGEHVPDSTALMACFVLTTQVSIRIRADLDKYRQLIPVLKYATACLSPPSGYRPCT